jgi:TetR/AcrR family transcriptional regulator, regulator of cefoperazone and chloramphenicol sensitivity
MLVMKPVTRKSAVGNSSASNVDPARTVDSDARKQRTDGAEARERLLGVALRLFAEKGFAKTSTRDIAQEAGANLSAIKYYFGDKAGLYRAAFVEPIGGECVEMPDLNGLTLRQTIEMFYTGFFEPLKQGDLVQLCIRLHYREMLEPTGLWAEKIETEIKPAHAALADALVHHLGVEKIDDDIHRLAFSIAGLAIQLFVSRDIINAIRPKLIATPAALDQWSARLVDYAEAMVIAEARRRAESGTDASSNASVRNSATSKKKNA